MDWLQTEVISHPEVLDRIIKAFSDGRKHDPGWAQLTVSIGNFGTAKKIMDGRLSNPPVPDNGLTNILSGQLLRFTALARNREKINKGEMKKMLGTHIEYVTTYNALAKERTTIKDMKSISTDALGQEVGTQGNYKKGGNKTGYEFIAANETILKAADEKLFKLIFETGGKIGDNLPAIQNHIINNYSNLDANIKPPDTEEGVLRSIGEYMKALLNAPNGKGDEAMERILNASLEQYKRDHDGETNLGTYQLREGEFSYHPQYPKEDRGMWGGK